MKADCNKKTNISICEKKLWLDIHKSKYADCVYDLEGNYANNSIKSLVCSSTENCIKVSQAEPVLMAEETSEVINDILRDYKTSPNVIVDAVFLLGDIIVYIDRLLVNSDSSIEFCEIKAATHVKDGFIKDISFKYAVLKILGYKVKNVFIGYINSSYIRHGRIDIRKLLFYKNITSAVNIYAQDMISKIGDSLELKKEPITQIDISCLSPHRCSYWKYCTKNFPEYTVFDIAGLALDKKFELYNAGIIALEDVEKNNCVSKRQMRQVSSMIHNTPTEIDKISLRNFLEGLSFPLYFLDFETFQSAIPKFDGVMPFTQIPFQFSLHYIERKGGDICHKEFLAEYERDPRRELAEKLVKYIPDDVCVLAYNMVFEKGVIRNLAYMFDDLSSHLMRIHDNIKDLMVPFQKQFYYDSKMMGSYSIKAVLPALFPDNPELDYKNLDTIHNGIEAMIMYQKAEEFDEKERENIRMSLLKYCGLDTFAMVKIWQKLCESVE